MWRFPVGSLADVLPFSLAWRGFPDLSPAFQVIDSLPEVMNLNNSWGLDHFGGKYQAWAGFFWAIHSVSIGKSAFFTGFPFRCLQAKAAG